MSDERSTGSSSRNGTRDLPKGLTWIEFQERPEIAQLDLDFVTASEMFEAYEGKP